MLLFHVYYQLSKANQLPYNKNVRNDYERKNVYCFILKLGSSKEVHLRNVIRQTVTRYCIKDSVNSIFMLNESFFVKLYK